MEIFFGLIQHERISIKLLIGLKTKMLLQTLLIMHFHVTLKSSPPLSGLVQSARNCKHGCRNFCIFVHFSANYAMREARHFFPHKVLLICTLNSKQWSTIEIKQLTSSYQHSTLLTYQLKEMFLFRDKN